MKFEHRDYKPEDLKPETKRDPQSYEGLVARILAIDVGGHVDESLIEKIEKLQQDVENTSASSEQKKYLKEMLEKRIPAKVKENTKTNERVHSEEHAEAA